MISDPALSQILPDGELDALAPFLVSVTRQAAIASAMWAGRGDEHEADQAAVNAMRQALGKVPFSGRIVIGEGERDQAPMLYAGEEMGSGGPACDLAVDPLEGTTITAKSLPGSLSVLAASHRDAMLFAPDVYLEKLAVGREVPEDLLDLDAPPDENLRRFARFRGVQVSELRVSVLDRPRHETLIRSIRQTGARIVLISDGDIHAAIQTALPDGIDLYMGIGGAPEGVLAAAALRCLGGQILTRFAPRDDGDRERIRSFGFENLDRILRTDDLVRGHTLFVATGVTTGTLLQGVRAGAGGACRTQTLVLGTGALKMSQIEESHRVDHQMDPRVDP